MDMDIHIDIDIDETLKESNGRDKTDLPFSLKFWEK